MLIHAFHSALFYSLLFTRERKHSFFNQIQQSTGCRNHNFGPTSQLGLLLRLGHSTIDTHTFNASDLCHHFLRLQGEFTSGCKNQNARTRHRRGRGSGARKRTQLRYFQQCRLTKNNNNIYHQKIK